MNDAVLAEIISFASSEKIRNQDCLHVEYSGRAALGKNQDAMRSLLKDLAALNSPEAEQFLKRLDSSGSAPRPCSDSREGVELTQSDSPSSSVCKQMDFFGAQFDEKAAVKPNHRSARRDAPCATSVQKLLFVDAAALMPHPLAEGVFPIDSSVLDALSDSMKARGFDSRFPVQCVSEGGQLLVWDGITRISAAKKAGVSKIPVLVSEFKDGHSMLLSMIEIQHFRRDSTDATVLRSVELLSEEAASIALCNRGRRTDLETSGQTCPDVGGGANELIAKIVRRSATTVKHAKIILKDAEAKRKVLAGELSLKQAYEEIRQKTARPRASENLSMSQEAVPMQESRKPVPESRKSEETVSGLAHGHDDLELDYSKTPDERSKICFSLPSVRKILSNLPKGILEEIARADSLALEQFSGSRLL